MVTLALGNTFTAAGMVIESTQPYFEVITNFTEKVPGTLYRWLGLAVVSVPPSPKLHLYRIAEKEGTTLWLVKFTIPLSQKRVLSKANFALAESTKTESVAFKVNGQPSGLVRTTLGM